MLPFKRTASPTIMTKWYELVEIMSGVNLTDDVDASV